MGAAEGQQATARLTDVFARPLDHARRCHEAGARVIAASWPTVPRELMIAAGFSPIVIRRDPGPTPRADARLEPGVFASRIRSIVDAAIGGDLACLDALILPRTAEQDYKAFLYLREFVREGTGGDGMPALHLFDLLQTDSPDARAYGLARTAALQETLETLTGRAVTRDALERSIVASNRARAAARALLEFRRHPARVSGAAVFPLLAAFWLLPHDEYERAAVVIAEDLSRRPPLDGPRILLAGAPVDHALFHDEIERHGAVVVAEDSPWGTRGAGDDISTSTAPLEAIFEKYYADVPSARTPAASSDAWFTRALGDGLDGVVFVLPPDDSVFGWEYPARRRQLDALGIPSLVIRDHALTGGATADAADRMAAFVARATEHSAERVHG